MPLHPTAPIPPDPYRLLEDYFADVADSIRLQRSALVRAIGHLCEHNNWILFRMLKDAGDEIVRAGLKPYFDGRLQEAETAYTAHPRPHSFYAGLSLVHYAIEGDRDAIKHITNRMLDGDLDIATGGMARAFFQLLHEFIHQWCVLETPDLRARIDSELNRLGKTPMDLDHAFGGRFNPTGDGLRVFQALNRLDQYTQTIDPGLLSGELEESPPVESPLAEEVPAAAIAEPTEKVQKQLVPGTYKDLKILGWAAVFGCNRNTVVPKHLCPLADKGEAAPLSRGWTLNLQR